jgi:RND family efflux transporter MFP subunit
VGGYFLARNKSVFTPAAPVAPQRETAVRIEARDIFFAVNAAGDIGPADQVSVRPEINGRIAELRVDIGDKVRKNDLLCRLDDQDLQIERSTRLTEIEGTRLQIGGSQLKLDQSRRDFERSKKLFDQSLIAREVFDNSRTDLEVAVNSLNLASNSLERAEKALNLVEDRLSKTKIQAPFACTVLTRPVSVGQAVSGSGGFNSGTEIMTVANLNEMVVNAHINQADVIRLSFGQKVNIEVESLPGTTMKGAIDRIAPQATIKNNIKGFAVRIQIREIDSRVRPGMTANLTIPVATVENVVAVPLAAVFTEQGERYVFVKEGENFERRTVTIGISDFQFAEVQSGLKEGEVVSLEPPKDILSAKGGKTNETGKAKSSAAAPGKTHS